MTVEPTEEDVEKFRRLVLKAADLHVWTWCTKTSWWRTTASLRGRECLRCPEFCVNGGPCDPI